MSKELCKLTRHQIEELLPKLVQELPNCKYICRRCARVAVSKKQLCKPQTMKHLLDEQILANQTP